MRVRARAPGVGPAVLPLDAVLDDGVLALKRGPHAEHLLHLEELVHHHSVGSQLDLLLALGACCAAHSRSASGPRRGRARRTRRALRAGVLTDTVLPKYHNLGHQRPRAAALCRATMARDAAVQHAATVVQNGDMGDVSAQSHPDLTRGLDLRAGESPVRGLERSCDKRLSSAFLSDHCRLSITCRGRASLGRIDLLPARLPSPRSAPKRPHVGRRPVYQGLAHRSRGGLSPAALCTQPDPCSWIAPHQREIGTHPTCAERVVSYSSGQGPTHRGARVGFM